MKKMDVFFRPASVAVIGASKDPKKIGHVIFRNFIEGGFKGEVYPINPTADEIMGRKCYPSILRVAGRIQLAIISVPAPMVPEILEECGRKGVHAAIIITSGFQEVGNHELEKKVEEVVRKHKISVIGPNCLGIFSPDTGVDTIFLPRYKLGRPELGDISFISQSGAVGSVVLDWMSMKGYTLSKFISYGNAMDVDEADLIEYLGTDRRTKVICAYLEGVKEGRKFFRVAKRVSKKKPIIILKGGVTEQGIKAVSSHTGSLAGSYEIYKSMFRQAGIIQANDMEELFDYARVLSRQPRPKGKKVQVITDGGGFGILLSDKLSENGLEFSVMSKENMDKVRKISPPYVTFGNPLDLTGDTGPDRYEVAINAAMDDPDVDMIAVIVLLQVPKLTADVVEVIAEAAKSRKKPIFVISAGGEFTEVLKKSLEDFGIPTFTYPQNAAKAMRQLYEFYRGKA